MEGNVRYLSYVRRNDCSLRKGIQYVVEPSWEKCTTGFRKVEPANGPKLNSQTLEKDGEQVGEKDNEEEAKAVRGSSSDVCRVIARIDFGCVCQCTLRRDIGGRNDDVL